MSVWQAFVLGVVQGLTEFLPISSSAHLIVVPWILGWPEPGLAFNVALHLGTLSAVTAYFWRDFVVIARGWIGSVRSGQHVRTAEGRLGWAIIVGSVPAGLAGLLGNDALDHYFHAGGGGRTAIVVSACLLIALGFALWAAEVRAKHVRPLEELRLRDGLVIGIAQMFALLPGVSRSGSTIAAGLFLGFQRPAAARFSFLLGTPAIVGAGLLEGWHLLSSGLSREELVPFLVGIATASVTGFLAIAFLLRFLQRYSTGVFVVYRLALGVTLLVLVLWS
ncbi:MAG: undecaprenyl-diphosphatase UppP [Thermomicrobium sp.]|nr:undecaprenyl-diphosphatase UppP [Thermomicrobium sp.]